MSTESPPDIISTATVVIFSPDMREIIVIVNEKLRKILPPWWKFDPQVDTTILDTALRETLQEIGLALLPETWAFLDQDGNPIDDPKQGATGYWDRVGQHWSNDFDPYNVDPKELERVSKLKGYSFMEVPTKRGKDAQEIVVLEDKFLS